MCWFFVLFVFFAANSSSSQLAQQAFLTETLSLTRQTNATDRKSLSLDILCEGFANSFIEFFYLTHRYDENGELQPECDFTEDELIFLKENLIMAELSEIKNDFRKTHSAYKNIGDFFKQANELETAVYFYKKCELQDNSKLKLNLLISDATTTTTTTNQTNQNQNISGNHPNDENSNNQNIGNTNDNGDNENNNNNKVDDSNKNTGSNSQIPILDKNSDDLTDQQLITYLDLGLTYELLKQINNAICYYTKYLDLAHIKLAKLKSENDMTLTKASKSGSQSTNSLTDYSTNGTEINTANQMISIGNRNLIRTYKLQSDKYEKEGKFSDAIKVLKQCINAAETAADLPGEAIAHLSMSQILITMSNANNANNAKKSENNSNNNDNTPKNDEKKTLQVAADHLKKLLKISLEIVDAINEAKAYYYLGYIYETLHDSVLASKYYESYMNVAVNHNNLEQESEACVKLADIYFYQMKNLEKASTYYAKYFDLCRKLRRINAMQLNQQSNNNSKSGMSGKDDNDENLNDQENENENENENDVDTNNANNDSQNQNVNSGVSGVATTNKFTITDTLRINQSVNEARIKVGVSKAREMMSQYLEWIVNNDSQSTKALLKWKSKRQLQLSSIN